ncbi:MAG: hypothetical protein O3B22_09180 [Proteobacteria bacterium]|nr:hypothetical protein [Pseudomonadota bacterium]MDA0951441.1 hypothetical protein [Pseudomonadota bacterium]
MNRTIRTLLASTAIAVALPAMAWAADGLPSPIEVNGGNITEAQIKDGLTELGYTDIEYIAGEGRYSTVRTHYNGSYVPLQVDADTGEVSRLGDPDMQSISIVEGTMDQDLEKGLRELGYSNVTIGAKQGRYAEATAWRYGQDVNLSIDLETGTVTNNEQDETWYVAMRNDMTDAQVGAELEKMGFTEVDELSQTEAGWSGYAVQDGEKMKVWIDAESGEVRAWKMDGQA